MEERTERTGPVRILLIEGDSGEAHRVQSTLLNSSSLVCEIAVADCLVAGLSRLGDGSVDLALLGLHLPDSQGLETVERVCAEAPDVPVVVLAGSGDDSLGPALRAGAQDYIDMTRLDGPLLARAVRYGLERHEARRALRRAVLQSEELERKLGAEALVVQRLKEVDRMKAEFVETVTHELRTPMTPLRSAIEMFLDGTLGEVTDDQRQMLEMMNRNVQRLARFATDVLALSRLDSGSHPLYPKPMDLAQVMEPTVGLLKTKAAEKGIAIVLAVDPGVGAFADADALSQVVSNLVDNAISHTLEGTTITVSCRPGGRDFVEVLVVDDGQGIPPHAVRRLFDRFYQADRQAGPGYKGTGIGLAVCKALVERMGGAISVDSRVGQGTTFRFTLPTDRLSHEILFGRIAFGLGYATKEQLREAIALQHTAAGRLKKMGDLLVAKGHLTRKQRDEVLQTQDRNHAAPHTHVPEASMGEALLGRIAVREGLVTGEEVNEAVRTQQKLKEAGEEARLGEILAGIADVSVGAVVRLLELQGRRILACGECESRFNAGHTVQESPPDCPRCGSRLGAPERTDEVNVDGDID